MQNMVVYLQCASYTFHVVSKISLSIFIKCKLFIFCKRLTYGPLNTAHVSRILVHNFRRPLSHQDGVLRISLPLVVRRINQIS